MGSPESGILGREKAGTDRLGCWAFLDRISQSRQA